MSFSHLFFGLPCGRIDIGFKLYTFFLLFSLPAFNVNGQIAKSLCFYVIYYILVS